MTDPERARLAAALRRYFEAGPSTFRTLINYLDIDYATAQDEGWLDMNNAIVLWEEAVEARARKEP